MGENLEDTMQVTQEELVKEQPTKTGDGYADYVFCVLLTSPAGRYASSIC
ncbi:hypothetical protein [Parendozoicomonas sp. Alg238-R29]|nr:hypothetical protein [Parendozoicomonas sp. Alg238-R29]